MFEPQIEEFHCTNEVNEALNIIAKQFTSTILSYIQNDNKSSTFGLNELCNLLDNSGLLEISKKTRMKMDKIRIQKKEKAFHNLMHLDIVSKNEHINFTNTIFNSKHKNAFKIIEESQNDSPFSKKND